MFYKKRIEVLEKEIKYLKSKECDIEELFVAISSSILSVVCQLLPRNDNILEIDRNKAINEVTGGLYLDMRKTYYALCIAKNCKDLSLIEIEKKLSNAGLDNEFIGSIIELAKKKQYLILCL